MSALAPLEILRTLGINGTPSVTSVQGGFDMAMWKVEHEGCLFTLRVFRPGAHDACEHERCVMEAAHAAGLPVPQVQKAGVWQERPVLLLSWLTGHTVEEELRTRPWRLWSLGQNFGRMLARIHAVSAPALLRQQPDAWISWKCAGEHSLHDRLRHMSSEKDILVHLDYHLRNVLTDGRRITGVIDWTNARAGDPRADVARTTSILRVDPVARETPGRRLLLRLFELAWRSGYQRERGQLKAMPLFYTWAGIVLQHDLAPRYDDRPHELAPARHWTNKWKARVIKDVPL